MLNFSPLHYVKYTRKVRMIQNEGSRADKIKINLKKLMRVLSDGMSKGLYRVLYIFFFICSLEQVNTITIKAKQSG